MSQTPLISVVVPLLDEEGHIDLLAERLDVIGAAQPDERFEFVLVDDGSTDRTPELLDDLAQRDHRVRVIHLSRNFGSHHALSAGFAYAKGDCVAFINADLQEPPDLVERMYQQRLNGFDTVWAVRQQRADSRFVSRMASVGFSATFTRFCDLPSYPAEGPASVLIDRKVVDTVNAMPERHRNLMALIAWVGFRSTKITFAAEWRKSGASKWTLGRRVKLALDSFVSFSSAPIRAASYIGMIAAALGFLYAATLVVMYATGQIDTAVGWPTVVVAIFVLGGIQLIMIGLIGEYLWRGVDETRQRPLYVVRSVAGMPESSDISERVDTDRAADTRAEIGASPPV